MHVLGICGDDGTPDIKQGLTREGVPPDQVKVRWMRLDRGGNQVEAVDVPEHLALQLLKKGRIRVGLISCSV